MSPISVNIRLSTLALKPRGDVTKSLKRGYQWHHKKDLCFPKFFFWKKGMFSLSIWKEYFRLSVIVEVFLSIFSTFSSSGNVLPSHGGYINTTMRHSTWFISNCNYVKHLITYGRSIMLSKVKIILNAKQ